LVAALPSPLSSFSNSTIGHPTGNAVLVFTGDSEISGLKVRQAAAAFVKDLPAKVKWSGPNGEKFKWISSLVDSDALSASIGPNALKIHHYTLSDDASLKTRLNHKFHEHGNSAWSLAKTAWSVV
jgi:hypothetical protein